MSNKELKDILNDIKNVKKEILRDKSTSIEFLNKIGVCDLKGNLKSPYK